MVWQMKLCLNSSVTFTRFLHTCADRAHVNRLQLTTLSVAVKSRCQLTHSVNCRKHNPLAKKCNDCGVFSNLHWRNVTHLIKRQQLYSTVKQSEDTSWMSDSDEQQFNEFMQKERKIYISREEQQALLKRKPKTSANQRILKVAIIGAPNAGKSTLANQLIGWKFSAVSSKVHTTRYKSLGVLTEDNTQIIFLDTPGIITPIQRTKYHMENSLLKDPHSSLYEADLIIAMVDASHVWNRSQLDVEMQKVLHFHRNKKSILVLNKIDIFPQEKELLHAARVLSEGVIGGRKDWYRTVKRNTNKKKISLTELYDKVASMDKHKNKANELSDNSSNTMRSVVGEEKDEPIKAPDNDYCENEPMVAVVTKEDISNDVSKPKEIPKLENPEEWHRYYSDEMQRVEETIQNRVGFDAFQRVFCISALEGTQVQDLRSYLLDEASPGHWEYDEEVVTDQDPVKLARMAVWERILDHLPKEIPYTVDLKNTVWAVDSDGLLQVEFELFVKRRYLHSVLSERGKVIQRIAFEAKQELMNTFRREMTLRLIVKPAPSKKKK